MANIELYNGGAKCSISYDDVMNSDGSKSLSEDISAFEATKDYVDGMQKVGGKVVHEFSEAFTIAGLVLKDGTWDMKHYLTAYHTDYIDITGFTKLEATGLWPNFYGVTFYDSEKGYISTIGSVSTATIIPTDYPTAQYVVFQAESDKTIASYTTYADDGTLTALTNAVDSINYGLKTAGIGTGKKIVLNGDSLCNQLGLQLMNICHHFGYDLLNRTRGGENIIGNLTRAGGMMARVTSEFTMPASGSVVVALGSAWMYSDGTYATTPYNWTPTSGQSAWIGDVKGKLYKGDMVAILAYNSSKTLVQTYSDDGYYTLDSSVKYIRININATTEGGVPHVTLGGVAQEDNCTISGYIDASDNLVANENYLHSDYISVTSAALYFDACASQSSFTFVRDEDGTSKKIGIGTLCYDNRLITDKQYPHIWFSGQNGGFNSEAEYASMTATAAHTFNGQNLVVTTHTKNCTNAIVYAATNEFGPHYLNIRGYLAGNAIYDGLRYGLITDTTLTPSDWEKTYLDSKAVHQNAQCAYLEAVQMWNKMVALNMVEGDMVDSADYYVSNVEEEDKVQYWYYVPEDGWGDDYPTSKIDG